MNQEETKRIQELCTSIISEKDQSKFAKLVRELDELMAVKKERLHQGGDPKPVPSSDGLQFSASFTRSPTTNAPERKSPAA